MLRKPIHVWLLGCLLAVALPASAGAQLTHAQAVIARARSVSAATGTVAAVGDGWVTIQTGGRRVGVVNAMVATANALARKNYNYVWGGGHPEAGVPTRAGHSLGFDCSGSVAAVLAGAGLWPAGSGVPNDAGVIAQLRAEGLIARGPGVAPYDVTLYDNPGYHIFMSIDGRFFGTSDGAGSGVSHGGPGWLYDGAPDAHTRAFRQWHILPSVLHDKASYGHDLTFSTSSWSLTEDLLVGDRVTVSYAAAGDGAMVATGVTFSGAVTVSGTVSAAGATGSTLTVQTAGGKTLTLSIGPGVSASAAIGDTVEILYTKTKSGYLARQLTVTSVPAATGTGSGSGGPGGSGGSSALGASGGSGMGGYPSPTPTPGGPWGANAS